MPEQTPKPRRRKAKAVTDEISTENVGEQTTQDTYRATEPKKYEPPEHMVALNDERYLKKDRVGKQKAVRGPGKAVTRVGLGGLKVIHQNPIDYHGNIDV